VSVVRLSRDHWAQSFDNGLDEWIIDGRQQGSGLQLRGRRKNWFYCCKSDTWLGLSDRDTLVATVCVSSVVRPISSFPAQR
jgi:hypothetical protein